MRARGATLAAAALVAAVAGCVRPSSYREPRLAPGQPGASSVDATAAALVGDWAGQYHSPVYAHRGDLRVSLRPAAPGAAGAATLAVAGTVSISGTLTEVDSARVDRGRVVMWLAPFADRATGYTVWLRLDGALAADTLGGRLQGHAAATAAAERRGGWRVVRVDRSAR